MNWRVVAACLFLAGATSRDAFAADERAECASAHASGQDLRKAEELRSAKEKFLFCSRPVCPTILIKECTSFLSEVDAAQPSIVVAVHDHAGVDALGARVFVDGVAVEGDALARPIILDPGAHDVRAQLGASTAIEHILLREGEQRRAVTVVVGDRATPIELGDRSGSRIGGAAETPRASSRPVPWYVPVTYIAAAASLGVGIGFGMDALGRNSALQSCIGACEGSRVDAMYRSALVSDVGLGVAVGFTVLGTILLLVRPTLSPRAAAALSGHMFPAW